MGSIDRIRFEGVSFSYEGSDGILNNVDFDFPTNQFVWIQSEEGAGKSSLLQVMAGLKSPRFGKYLLNEADVAEMSFEEFLPYRLKIGYTFDYGGLLSNRTLHDNLALPILFHKLATPQEAKYQVDELLKEFGLSKVSSERPAHVSGRIRKMVCLLRPLLMKPDLLLMDDPSVGIGNEMVHHFVEYVQGMRSQGYLKHIFVSSYDEKFVELFDHETIFLTEGQILKSSMEPTKRVVSF